MVTLCASNTKLSWHSGFMGYQKQKYTFTRKNDLLKICANIETERGKEDKKKTYFTCFHFASGFRSSQQINSIFQCKQWIWHTIHRFTFGALCIYCARRLSEQQLKLLHVLCFTVCAVHVCVVRLCFAHLTQPWGRICRKENHIWTTSNSNFRHDAISKRYGPYSMLSIFWWNRCNTLKRTTSATRKNSWANEIFQIFSTSIPRRKFIRSIIISFINSVDWCNCIRLTGPFPTPWNESAEMRYGRQKYDKYYFLYVKIFRMSICIL